MAGNNQYLNFVRFSNLSNWSASALIGKKFSYIDKFPLVSIGEFLKRTRDVIQVQDDTSYSRVTVRINNGGVLLRDIEIGENIGTKTQFLVREGQFIISKIDARNGAMGIIPGELEGAIVTNDFPVFDVDNSKILTQFLVLVTTTKHFIEFAQSCSSGTTNRQRIDLDAFLNVEIPLPRIDSDDPEEVTQTRIVNEYLEKISESVSQKENAAVLESTANEYLAKSLGITLKAERSRQNGLQFVRYKEMNEWGVGKLISQKKYQSKSYPTTSLGVDESLFVDIFRGKSPKYDEVGYSLINQKCVRWNKIDLRFSKTVNKDWLDGIDRRFFTTEGDVLINSTGEGTIGRAAVVDVDAAGYLYDSHVLLLRLDAQKILPEFFVEVFNSPYGQRQVEDVKSAQSTKQTELGIDNLKRIVFPYIQDLSVQKEIVDYIKGLRIRMVESLKRFEELQAAAIEEFEKAIFSD